MGSNPSAQCESVGSQIGTCGVIGNMSLCHSEVRSSNLPRSADTKKVKDIHMTCQDLL